MLYVLQHKVSHYIKRIHSVLFGKKMATGAKMSFNYYQNGKYGTLPQNPQKDMEVTHDMHLKMSKKIAQLTKVWLFINDVFV